MPIPERHELGFHFAALQVVLARMAQHGESASIEQLHRAMRLPNSALQPRISGLISKGLIYRPSRGYVAYTAPMFGAYMRRRAG
jgi:RIO-like serine/threonine protein kinase